MDSGKPIEITKDILHIAETFDHIMTTDVTGRGSIPLLYSAARKKTGKPLALSAAAELVNRVK
jgi:hypothetical protein